ncbi:hypothetical protein BDV25DRAFT_37456 [Aspergillus avenaceus]|uniref:Uncharacterized protein n=1 Tax=Aspergillus avenaceus TaxID=36643 RepID=A0A5N6TLM2_ASPAV|nr:hypothetical protein BDV25DRAFT_37456 [Aspergillus avenaceus]
MDMPEVAQQTSAFLPIQLDRASISHSSISTPVHRPRHNPTASPWSVGQAMFAVMGGFAIETEYIDLMDAKRTIRRLVTPEGVAVLVKTGHLPFIDREDVAERSKADVFAKGVVVIQIIWFALQVLGRLLQGLSVTPLETHTAIHVGCTVFVYASWANKPYNVLRSMLITGPEMQYIGAFFNFSDLSGVVYNKQCEKYEVERMEYWKDRIIQASRGVSAFDMLLFTGSIGLHEVIAI